MVRKNVLGQPVGEPVVQVFPRPLPPKTAMVGRYCTLSPTNPETDSAGLFEAFAEDEEDRIWTYMPHGPYSSADDYRDWAIPTCAADDPMFFTIFDGRGRIGGIASFLRINPEVGSIEVGWITYAPRLQRTRAATEAMYLMMRRAFDELGYRRYEWKCDALNEGSRRAAARLGFIYEGTFQQATHYKGRNRDTAWFAIIDKDWPAIRAEYERWLDPANFDADGGQLSSLRTL